MLPATWPSRNWATAVPCRLRFGRGFSQPGHSEKPYGHCHARRLRPSSVVPAHAGTKQLAGEFHRLALWRQRRPSHRTPSARQMLSAQTTATNPSYGCPAHPLSVASDAPSSAACSTNGHLCWLRHPEPPFLGWIRGSIVAMTSFACNFEVLAVALQAAHICRGPPALPV